MIGWVTAVVIYLLGANLAKWVYPKLLEDTPTWADRLTFLVWPLVELYSMVMVAIYGEEGE
jgi:uncharacterized protein involved in cysteine biosynthesis